MHCVEIISHHVAGGGVSSVDECFRWHPFDRSRVAIIETHQLVVVRKKIARQCAVRQSDAQLTVDARGRHDQTIAKIVKFY
jgi:hypothetical protein